MLNKTNLFGQHMRDWMLINSTLEFINEWMTASHRVIIDSLHHQLFLWDPEHKLLCRRDISWNNYDDLAMELCGKAQMGCTVDEEKATVILLGGYDKGR